MIEDSVHAQQNQRIAAEVGEGGIGREQLASASPELLPLNQAMEKQRSTTVEQNVGAISPGLVKFTTQPLFLDLWQRPGLKPRDRSLVTISALTALGKTDQLRFHLAFARRNGVTDEELKEALLQLAFYSGWPNGMGATAVLKDIIGDEG